MFDERIVVDREFRTNDEFIYAVCSPFLLWRRAPSPPCSMAHLPFSPCIFFPPSFLLLSQTGSCAKFSRKYYADGLDLARVSSVELGQQLARAMLPLFDPLIKQEVVEFAALAPSFTQRKATLGWFPGGLQFVILLSRKMLWNSLPSQSLFFLRQVSQLRGCRLGQRRRNTGNGRRGVHGTSPVAAARDRPSHMPLAGMLSFSFGGERKKEKKKKKRNKKITKKDKT